MKILDFLNLSDTKGNLSITSLGAYVALGLTVYGMVTGMTPEMLLSSLLLYVNYFHRRYTQSSEHKKELEIPKTQEIPDVEHLKTEIEQLKSVISFMKKGK